MSCPIYLVWIIVVACIYATAEEDEYLQRFFQEVSNLDYVYRKLDLEHPSEVFYPAVEKQVKEFPESLVINLSLIPSKVFAKYFTVGDQYQISSIVAFMGRFPRERRLSIYKDALHLLEEFPIEEKREVYYYLENDMIWTTTKTHRAEFLKGLIESEEQEEGGP